MKQLFLLIALFFLFINVTAQTDSITASHIKTVVEGIEDELEGDIELTTDTTIMDKEGTMTVHTSYFIDPGSGMVEKIMEKTLFGSLTTEIIIYYNGRSPILFSSKQWQGAELKIDFDYYLQANSPIYLVKREFGKGKPDSGEILKWCDQLLKESDNKKSLVKTTPTKPVQKITSSKKITQKSTTDSTKKTTTKKPLLPFFKKKKN